MTGISFLEGYYVGRTDQAFSVAKLTFTTSPFHDMFKPDHLHI